MTTATNISRAEVYYLTEGIALNTRADGRTNSQYRYFSVVPNPLPTATSSVRIQLGRTDILIVITAELDNPADDAPDSGALHFYVDSNRTAYNDLIHTGAVASNTAADDLNLQIASALHTVYNNPSGLNLQQLCVIPGQSVWHLHIDCHVFYTDGNTLDAAAIGVTAALHLVQLPKVEVVETTDGEKEIQVDDDPSQSTPLDTKTLPIVVTLNRVGSVHNVLDIDAQEEACVSSKVTYAVTAEGRILTQLSTQATAGGIQIDQKDSKAPHTATTGMTLSSLRQLRETAKQTGMQLHQQILAMSKEHDSDDVEVTGSGHADAMLIT